MKGRFHHIDASYRIGQDIETLLQEVMKTAIIEPKFGEAFLNKFIIKNFNLL